MDQIKMIGHQTKGVNLRQNLAGAIAEAINSLWGMAKALRLRPPIRPASCSSLES